MVRTLLSAPPTGRVGRYPKHPFNVKGLPYTLTPCGLARVLPGETLQNIYMESRLVTDPIANKLSPWALEYFVFYCRVTDLLNDSIRDMFIDPDNVDLTATLGIASRDQAWNTAKGGIDYLKRCTQRVWEEYFSDEGDTFASHLVSGVDASVNGHPIIPFRDLFWMDSITEVGDMPDGGAISGATNADDLEALMNAFEHLRALGIANMTYEDFLRSYGMAIPNKDENKPELIAHWKDSQYPTNTVTEGTGAVTSAVSAVFKNSMRDPKMFKEPGFLVMYQVVRPKLFYTGMVGSLAAHAGRAWDWVPNYLYEASAQPMPETALKTFAADTGPLGDRLTATDPYIVDMHDDLIHGDQFTNRNTFADGANIADIPGYHGLDKPASASIGNETMRYPTSADMTGLFVTAADCYAVADGFFSLSIKGRQVDYTQGNLAQI